MKSKLTRQQMLAVGVAVFGLVLGLGSYMILVAPQKSKAIALAGAVDAAQSSLYVVQHKPHRVVQKRKPKPPDVQAADLFRLTKAMPDSPDVPGILLSLMRFAKASSLELVSVQPAATPATATPLGYSAVPVAVTVHGKFANIANFLQRLRESVTVRHDHLKVTNRLFVPSQISLTIADAGTLDASISLDAFVYGTPPPPPTTTAATTTTTSTG
jgi:Tfp pilus assembly protein PilO